MAKVINSKIFEVNVYSSPFVPRRPVKVQGEQIERCPFTQPERTVARLWEAPHNEDNPTPLDVEIWMCLGVYEKNKRSSFCAQSCPFYRAVFSRPKREELE